MNPPRRGTPDFLLLLLTFALVGFGLVMVFSASYNLNADPLYFTKRQSLWAVLGTGAMLFLMNLNYKKLKVWFVPFFVATLFLLVFVLLFGVERNGAKSWFGIGSIGGQPTEFAKLAIILYLSALISKKGEKIRDFKTGFLPVLMIVGFVALLIMLQPDLGSTMILVLTATILMIAGGVNLKHLFMIGGAMSLLLAIFVSVSLLRGHTESYRLDRFTAFVDPWSHQLDSGFHTVQSLYAFGHGGLSGAGFGQSIQKLFYLPEAHNDFIFAIIGEELGFVGSLIFLLVYLLFLWRGLLIALRSTDPFGVLVGTGIISMIGVQAVINIGGVTNVIPITGVTLPFISFGGSSLLTTMMSTGILLSISRENTRLNREQQT
ncbi:putative lipid II flippase FtsW [Ferviditalea candida]|uniref:Lipid II flippase FtsW n=1 Tax=Ferviditalea candida TaxID=3108399 RepID=A0ABU5ZNT8_9BACL|nr:putative lipid II flippase FtsW [Paenibacillaceae bacterium T2]